MAKRTKGSRGAAVEGGGSVGSPGGGVAPEVTRLRVERVAIEELKGDPANARKHGDRNLAEIESSLKDHGQVEPIVIQARTGRIIAGHGRWEAMKRLGWETCEVVRLDVDDMECVRLGIRLNRTGELAEWDDGILERIFRDMPDLGAVGFNPEEVDRILEGAAVAPADGEGHGEGGGESIGEKYEVVVECSGEAEQRKVFEKLKGQGYAVRALTV